MHHRNDRREKPREDKRCEEIKTGKDKVNPKTLKGLYLEAI